MPAVDQLLVSNGFRPFDQMSNAIVEAHYGSHKCTPELHELRMWCDPGHRAAISSKLRVAQAGNTKYLSCTRGNKSSRTINCVDCDKKSVIRISLYRAVAILAEPVENAWMSVLHPPYVRGVCLFEASAICNHYSRDIHCISDGHVFLESHIQNLARQSHHGGRKGCDCDITCLGANVKPPGEGSHEEEER
jgi:hypothetical protein